MHYLSLTLVSECWSFWTTTMKYIFYGLNKEHTSDTVHFIISSHLCRNALCLRKNSQYTFEMMLDTGASGIIITKKMADILRVNHHENVWVSTPSSKYVKMSSGYVYSVGVGKLTFIIKLESITYA